ncbi:hypothetical protein BDY24DRAFT_417514 [Mrakia frigida]|uniref:uncharacterized protein n=1 Tax=Mrakia frigida TaxID=29902 RepID=UPI003FCC1974
MSSIHVSLPVSGTTRSPTLLTLQALPLLSILNHHTRRPIPSQPRVIGALIGRRTDAGEVVVTNAYAVPHDETRVYFAEKEHKDLLEAFRKVGGDKEGLVGWYATTPTPDVFSALIQNFFSGETAPYPAVHLTVDVTAPASEGSIKAFVSSPIGILPNEFCTFLPLPLSLPSNPPSLLHSTPPTPLASLELALAQTRKDLALVRAYVDSVVSGEKEGDAKVGRELMDVVGRSGEAGNGAEWKKGVEGQLQDTLMVSYLSSLVRSQVELAARINLMQV